MISTWVGSRGTIQDFPGFNASKDAEALKKAMEGLGTDETTVIEILTGRSNAQRQLIAAEYKSYTGKELKEALKGDTSGDFGHILLNLVTPPAEFDAEQINRTVRGMGTNETALIEIVASRTAKQIRETTQAYYTMYRSIMSEDVGWDTSGDFKRTLLALLEAKRDDSPEAHEDVAKRDAQLLYGAGEKRLGTDETKFIEILSSSSVAQLKLTFEEYKKLSGHRMEDTVLNETSGDFAELLLAVVKCVNNTPAFFAEKLNKSIKGPGTDEITLSRILVSRSEIDLLDIRQEYKNLYGESLHSALSSDSSGDYRRTVLRICGGDD
ncbi:annexin A3 [Ahaetulla prasina]|uniref:annexin A3 n=1 Tax=Ahaetulla prasina TaxID=499056 RepID=UPI0026497610|nr:annexin A3 [Ahaetulla prasina]XP_058049062.1 annexin A3 [Ahaetulla prasina]